MENNVTATETQGVQDIGNVATETQAEQAPQMDNALMEQLYHMQNEFSAQMQEQMQNTLKQQADAQNSQIQELRQMLMPEEQKQNQTQINILREQLGLDKMQELQEQMKAMQEQNQAMQREYQLRQAEQGFNALVQKYPNFNRESVAKELISISQTNRDLALALDNPIGWELIYLARLANTQPKADLHISNQNPTPQVDLDRLKAGNMSLEEIGQMF